MSRGDFASCLSRHQSAMSKNCVKLLCEDPVFAEYIKCILMDERTFLNNNIVYTFLTHFLLKVGGLLGIISIYIYICYFRFGMLFSQILLLWFINMFFSQVQGQVFSEANCANLINTLITNLINQYQSLESDFSNQRVEISKASSTLNGVSLF